MADLKISQLTGATTPLAGTEVLPIVQSGATKQVSVANLTAGRSISTTGVTVSSNTGNIELNWAAGSTHTVGSAFSAAFFTGMRVDADTRNTDIISLDATGIGNVRIRTGTTETTQLNVDPTGNVTINTGNVIIGTSGKGIDFSATPGTGTSELLADYEEGTWTPGITFGGASAGVTYTSTQGYYTKVGNVVTVSCYINMSNKGSSTGVARITALPFTCANNAAAYAAPSLFFANLTFTGQVNAYVNINDTTIDLFNTSVLGAASALTDTNFANNTGIIINLTYRAI
jgi:aspartate 1-decarboxylase